MQWNEVHRMTALVGENESDLKNFWELHIRMNINEIRNNSLERKPGIKPNFHNQ